MLTFAHELIEIGLLWSGIKQGQAFLPLMSPGGNLAKTSLTQSGSHIGRKKLV
jgi:hypothetical protein